MKTLALLMLCGALAVGTALAQDKPAAPAAADSKPASTSDAGKAKQPAAAKDAKDAASAKDAAAAKDEAKAQPSAADASKPAKDGTPQRFIPSEQVRSDFDVSFPVDI